MTTEAVRRLIRNIEGEPLPLITHRRLSWLRTADSLVRHRACIAVGIPFSGPRYLVARRTPEQRARTRLAIEAYVGMRSPDPRLVRYFKERCRLMELTDPTVADDTKRLLAAEGPRCSREDEAHALSLCEAGLHWSADPEAQAALGGGCITRCASTRATDSRWSAPVPRGGRAASAPGREPVGTIL